MESSRTVWAYRISLSVAAALTAIVAGCTDAAEADYKHCEQLDMEGKFEEALKACREAQKKDARSPFGQKATALESNLYDKIAARKKKKEQEDKDNAEFARLEAAKAKVVFNRKSTPPNDPDGYSERCMARNRAYENSYECEPKEPSSVKEGEAFPMKEECMLVATSRGCTPFYEKTPSKLFCCTQ